MRAPIRATVRWLLITAAIVLGGGWLAASDGCAACGDYVTVGHPAPQGGEGGESEFVRDVVPLPPCNFGGCSAPVDDGTRAGTIAAPSGPDQWAFAAPPAPTDDEPAACHLAGGAAVWLPPLPSVIFHPPR